MVALPSADHAKALRLLALNKILARQLDGGLIGFRPTGAKINSPSAAHAFRSQGEQPGSKFFRGGGVKLRAMGKGELRGLTGHRTAHGSNAMPDIDYRCLSRCIQIFFAVGGGKPAAFPGNSERIALVEVAGKQRWMIRHGVRILAEQRQANPHNSAKFCQSLSDVGHRAEELVIFRISAFTLVDRLDVFDKLNGLYPLHHLEPEFVFRAQPQRCAVRNQRAP